MYSCGRPCLGGAGEVAGAGQDLVGDEGRGGQQEGGHSRSSSILSNGSSRADDVHRLPPLPTNRNGAGAGGDGGGAPAVAGVPGPDQYDYSAYGGYEAYMAQAAAAEREEVAGMGGQSEQQEGFFPPRPPTAPPLAVQLPELFRQLSGLAVQRRLPRHEPQPQRQQAR